MNVTTKDLIKSVMNFQWTDRASGKAKAIAFSQAQKAVSSLARITPVSQQRVLKNRSTQLHPKTVCSLLDIHIQMLQCSLHSWFFVISSSSSRTVQSSSRSPQEITAALQEPAGTVSNDPEAAWK